MIRKIKTPALMAFIVVLSAVVGILLLAASYCLPTWMARYHMDESLQTFVDEGPYKNLYGLSRPCYNLDNHTDAIMISKAEYSSGDAAFADAVYCKHEVAVGCQAQIPSFYMELNDPWVEKTTSSYSRYWHGYLLVLKPLLMHFNYMEIRSINLAVQILLALICIGLLISKRKLRPYVPAFVILFLFQDIYLTSRSLQYSSVYYVYMAGSVFLILFYEKLDKHKVLPFFFLMMGILTSYFDFLTYPLITYGVPVTVYLLLEEKPELWPRLKNIVLFGLSWIFGYGGMWLCKGLVGNIITGENILNEIFSSATVRAGSNNYEAHETFSRLDSIARNSRTFSEFFPFWAFVGLFLILLLVLIFFSASKNSSASPIDRIKTAIPFLVISVSPFCWYLVLSNHSYIHAFFTCKTLYITVFALLCMLIKLYSAAVSCKKQSSC